jgi:hypothetical protein
MILYLLNLLQNSLEQDNQKLPTIISVFLAEAILIIVEPG